LKAFEYFRPDTILETSQILSVGEDRRLVSGNTDLLGEIKSGTIEPSALVSLTAIKELRGICWSEEGLKIGSMVTLAEIASDPEIKSRCGALTLAAESVATTQIRNQGTLGGNLCQRPRCWYYRSRMFNCLKKGGDRCYAIGGLDKYHAVVGTNKCIIIHPSDTATALMALDANVSIFSGSSEKVIPITEFFITPDVDVTKENILSSDEILVSINIPMESLDNSMTFMKAKERQSMDFALANIATVIRMERKKILRAGICVGGIAPVPLRLRLIEDYLKDLNFDDLDFEYVTELFLRETRPMDVNNYKILISKAYIRRSLTEIITLG
jgi:xanthine dehydrogenase YagS FAD-binding subunit